MHGIAKDSHAYMPIDAHTHIHTSANAHITNVRKFSVGEGNLLSANTLTRTRNTQLSRAPVPFIRIFFVKSLREGIYEFPGNKRSNIRACIYIQAACIYTHTPTQHAHSPAYPLSEYSSSNPQVRVSAMHE